MDTMTDLFVWIGQNTTENERKNAMIYAHVSRYNSFIYVYHHSVWIFLYELHASVYTIMNSRVLSAFNIHFREITNMQTIGSLDNIRLNLLFIQIYLMHNKIFYFEITNRGSYMSAHVLLNILNKNVRLV